MKGKYEQTVVRMRQQVHVRDAPWAGALGVIDQKQWVLSPSPAHRAMVQLSING
jgi:hypothetical protein